MFKTYKTKKTYKKSYKKAAKTKKRYNKSYKTKKTFKGGVIFNERFGSSSHEDALFFFIENSSEIRILTDNSISCVTYVVTLDSRVEMSPYLTIRSTNLMAPVRKILFKIGFVSRLGKKEYIPFIRAISKETDYYKGKIKALPLLDLQNEINIQEQLYKTTATDPLSLLEPICPGIICYSTNVSSRFKDYLGQQILGKLVDRGLVGRVRDYVRNDAQVTEGLFADIANSMYLIVMEFMDGYETLHSLSDDASFDDFELMAKYEFDRLNKLGFIHGDTNTSNILINPNYPYFTTVETHRFYGRALIIDFGCSEKTNRIVRNEISISSNFREITLLQYLRGIMANEFIKALGDESMAKLADLISGHLIELATVRFDRGLLTLPRVVPDVVPHSVPDADEGFPDYVDYDEVVPEVVPEVDIPRINAMFEILIDHMLNLYNWMVNNPMVRVDITIHKNEIKNRINEIKNEVGYYEGVFFQSIRIEQLMNAIELQEQKSKGYVGGGVFAVPKDKGLAVPKDKGLSVTKDNGLVVHNKDIDFMTLKKMIDGLFAVPAKIDLNKLVISEKHV